MPHRLFGILLLASILGSTGACRPIGPADIPQVRPDGWVVDLVGVLSPQEVAELERLGNAVNERDGAALAVLTVQSTAGLDRRVLASRAFDRWGLGDQGRDKGVLIFVATDEHIVEVVLGSGIHSDAEVAKRDQILENKMVPRFRRMEPNLGILSGARAFAAQFFGVGGPELEALPLPVPAPTSRPWRAPLPSVSIGLGVLALAFGVRQWALYRQRRPRRCRHCRRPMVRLDETQLSNHLASGELVEERLGSVDYEVWQCQECGAVEKLRAHNKFTAYRLCPACQIYAADDVGRVLSHPTYTSKGLREVRLICKACYHQAAASTEDIPQSPSSLFLVVVRVLRIFPVLLFLARWWRILWSPSLLSFVVVRVLHALHVRFRWWRKRLSSRQ